MHIIFGINVLINNFVNLTFQMPILSKRDSNGDIDNIFIFDTVINTLGGELNISFNIIFLNDFKLAVDAPQKWCVSLPVNTWTVNALTGTLPTHISVKLPEDGVCNKLCVLLNIVACTTNLCVPLQLSVVFNVYRSADAPTFVTEEKNLIIE